MPEPSDKYKPTEADLDLVIEEATGQPLKPKDLVTGIDSLHERIKELEAEKARLLDRLEKDFDETLKDHLAAVNRDLTTARERLAHYDVQLGTQN